MDSVKSYLEGDGVPPTKREFHTLSDFSADLK